MAVTRDEVLDEIRVQLDAIKVPNAGDAKPEDTWADLDVDSLDLVELVKALEDRFDIEISDDDLKPIESVGAAIKLTMRLSDAKEGSPAWPRARPHIPARTSTSPSLAVVSSPRSPRA